MASAMLVLLGVVVFIRWRRLRRVSDAEVTRLVFHPLLASGVMWSAVLGALVVSIGTGCSLAEYELPAILKRLRGMDFISGHVAATVVVVSPLLVGAMRTGLDLAGDVIHYLEGNRRSLLKRPGGNAIRQRFRSVLQYVLEHGVSQILVVSHSQGTVIALDELAHMDAALSKRMGTMRVRLVTMGSPISHLYQHYFPSTYPDWSSDTWQSLFSRLESWTNIFRRDDFVGTRIRIDPKERVEIDNQAIGLGGHSNYWTDARVVRELRRRRILSGPMLLYRQRGED
jgi:hypothetical protein